MWMWGSNVSFYSIHQLISIQIDLLLHTRLSCDRISPYALHRPVETCWLSQQSGCGRRADSQPFVAIKLSRLTLSLIVRLDRLVKKSHRRGKAVSGNPIEPADPSSRPSDQIPLILRRSSRLEPDPKSALISRTRTAPHPPPCNPVCRPVRTAGNPAKFNKQLLLLASHSHPPTCVHGDKGARTHNVCEEPLFCLPSLIHRWRWNRQFLSCR